MFQLVIRVQHFTSPVPATGPQAPGALASFTAGHVPVIVAGRDSRHSMREGRA
jgi:hypothetical protein